MPDLHRKELEDFQAYRSTFIGDKFGQRVLAGLMDAFSYNRMETPQCDIDLARLEGSRDVIRYILGKLGFGENEKFVSALSMIHVKGPEPYQQTEADTE